MTGMERYKDFLRLKIYLNETYLHFDGEIESVIGVQWGQENPNPRVHRSSGNRGLPKCSFFLF